MNYPLIPVKKILFIQGSIFLSYLLYYTTAIFSNSPSLRTLLTAERLGSLAAVKRQRNNGQVHPIVYARHGRDLMGCESPVCEPCASWFEERTQTLADGKGGTARDRLEEAGVQSYEPTNRNGIQGRVSG